MTKGSASVRAQVKEINAKGLDATPKEKSLLTVLEIALEMWERGISLARPDLYKSDATTFLIEGNTLIPPFNSVPSLGTNVANSIVEARKDGEFLSKEDFQQRGRVSKTIVEYMDALGCLEGMPEANQLSLSRICYVFRITIWVVVGHLLYNPQRERNYTNKRTLLFGLFAPSNIVWYDGNNFCNSLAQKEWDFPLFSVVLYCFLILFGRS